MYQSRREVTQAWFLVVRSVAGDLRENKKTKLIGFGEYIGRMQKKTEFSFTVLREPVD